MDSTKPLDGDPAPPLPRYFDSASSTMKYASLDDSICLTCGKLGLHVHSIGSKEELTLHATLDPADFAPQVPNHEHRWVTEVEVGFSSLPIAWAKQRLVDDVEIPLSAVFCAYPHCPEKP